MKTSMYKYWVMGLVFAFVLTTSCEVDTVQDPNNPSLESVTSDADKSALQSLVYGLEGRQRIYFDNATEMWGSFAREVFAYFGSDPRFQSDWLGSNITETYPDFFASGGTYTSPYLAVKQANSIIIAAEASSALNETERSALLGYARTIKAYQLSWPLNHQFQNGIRVEVEDPLNPGPFLDYDQALQDIRNQLDQALTELGAGGDNFFFSLTSGYTGFDTPETFAQVNRAIAARMALYAEDWAGALDALALSFIDLDVDAATSEKMFIGPQHTYGNAPDINNPLFYPFDQPTNTILIVHPAMIEDALPGDERLNKFTKRSPENFLTNSGITDLNGDQIPGEYQDARWPSNTAPITYIRNEELILIYAEANARLNNTGEAVNAINIVRNTWGVGDYTGPTDLESLIDEILFQRRYSLWAEAGHRWVDLRRTGRLNSNFVDLRDGGNLFTQVARPIQESN